MRRIGGQLSANGRASERADNRLSIDGDRLLGLVNKMDVNIYSRHCRTHLLRKYHIRPRTSVQQRLGTKRGPRDERKRGGEEKVWQNRIGGEFGGEALRISYSVRLQCGTAYA